LVQARPGGAAYLPEFLERRDSAGRVVGGHHPSRAVVEERRTKRSAAGQLGGIASGESRGRPDEASGEAITKQVASHVAEQNANPDSRIPIPRIPSPPSPHGEIRHSRDSAAALERADVQALLDRGWRRVTVKQRTILDEIADRHRRKGDDGSWFAVAAIAGAGQLDPLRAVIAADRDEQDANRRRVADEEIAWSQVKARERREADAIVGGGRSAAPPGATA